MKTRENTISNLNKTDLRGMSRDSVLRLIQVLGDWKTDDDMDTQYRTQIEKMSSESGSPTVKDFLIRLGYVPDPTVKRPRTKIDPVKREEIVRDLKSGTLTTNEISQRYGVTVDAVYNIKSKVGLTKPREKVVMVKTEETKDKTVIVPTPPPVAPSDQGQIAA